MIVKFPKRYAHLIPKLNEQELMLIVFMHMLKMKYQDTDWFSVWKYDVSIILAEVGPAASPAFMFKNLTSVFKAAWTCNHKLEIKFKRWDREEIDYEIKHIRNVILWSYILDQGQTGTYIEYKKDILNDSYWNVAALNKRHMASALKRFERYDT